MFKLNTFPDLIARCIEDTNPAAIGITAKEGPFLIPILKTLEEDEQAWQFCGAWVKEGDQSDGFSYRLIKLPSK